MKCGNAANWLQLSSVLGLGAVVFLSGCGEFFSPVNNNPTGTGSSSYVYVTNTGGTLSEYSLTTVSGNGTLTALSGSPITLPVAATSIVVAPNNAFLYVGTGTGVFLYTIGSNGTLTEGNNATVVYLNSTIVSPVVQSMVIDPTSSWLIMAYQGSTKIDALPLDPTTGLPTSQTAFEVNSTFAAPLPQLAITSSTATNPQVYVALGTGGTEVFGFNASKTTGNGPWGTTASIKLLSANSSDTAVAIDPTSTYAYIVEANVAATPTAGSLRVFKTADLTSDLNDYATGIGSSAVLADFTGTYVYVANATDGTISGFTQSAGVLTPFGSTIPSTTSAIALVEDSSKTYIMNLGNDTSQNFWLYNFDTTANDGSLDITKTATIGGTASIANGIAVTH